MAEARDHETRERLLTAATRLFAENGFDAVTVRDISDRAKANVAAVNYHFGGKLGLYDEVMRSAIRIMHSTTEEAQREGAGKAPEEQLRAYVRIFITRIVAAAGDNWIHQLMTREMSNPTPALDMVINQVIRPRMTFLADIMAALLKCPADDPRVMATAFSIHSQCIGLMNHGIADRLNPALGITRPSLDEMVDHITRFSLGGIAAVRNSRNGEEDRSQKTESRRA
jgi:AcrR family transcriptional regulator